MAPQLDTNTRAGDAAADILETFFDSFGKALEAADIDAVLDLCNDECYWKDLIVFTWNIYTAEGKDQIKDMLTARLSDTKPVNFKVIDTNLASSDDQVTQGFFSFETKTGEAKGYVRLKNNKIWTLMTSLQNLKGYEFPVGDKRIRGAEHGCKKAGPNWLDLKNQEEQELGYTKQPYVLIVGGGQGGMALGARLKKLGVPALICDKLPRPGDQWRSRYKSLCLHDPVWYDHMPYLKFPEDWPIFCPKDKMGDWLEAYTKIMELNYWGNAEVKKANFNESSKTWDVEVVRDGELVTIHPNHVVMALGVSGFPNVPKFPGYEKFQGDQHHSSQHPSGEKYKGKKVIVVGANNSAHDICADLWSHDADVTMLQRSSTHIIQSDTFIDLVTGPVYSEEACAKGIDVDRADLLFVSAPFKVMPQLHIPIFENVRRRDKVFYDKLEKAGFLHDFGDDESGMFMKYIRRGSGYYINVGASELVISGDVKLRRGEIQEIKEKSVILNDGSEVEVDAIVYATGYGSQTQWVEAICGSKVANKIGRSWGLGSNTTKDPGPWEGELRNMWKPTKQENLWVTGGNLSQARHYSKYIAMQLKARYEKMPIEVYGIPEVNHIR